MNELIKITTNEEGQNCVSARELHEGLGNKRRFTDWMKQRIEKYGFEENVDYICISQNCETQRANGQKGITVKKDYVVTIDMAKELCMVENNDLGRKFRKYFIECEKQLKEINTQEQLKANLLLSIYNGGQEGIVASKQLVELETKPLLKQIEEQKPLVSFATQVTNSSDCIDIGQFAKVLKDENIKIGRNKLFSWLRENKYLMNNNEPYQKFIDNGYFTVVEVTKQTAYGVKIYTKTLITGKGQIYILEKLRG